jgi:hypothetical protein
MGNFMELTLTQAIDYLESIPTEKWCIGSLYNTTGKGVKQRCALGHLSELLCGTPHGYVTHDFARNVINRLGNKLLQFTPPPMYQRGDWAIANINNNEEDTLNHFGTTPKERIVNALKLARKLEKREPVVEPRKFA